MTAPTAAQQAALWSMGAIVAVTVGGALFVGGWAARDATRHDSAAAAAAGDRFSALNEIYAALKDNYVDPAHIDQVDLKQGAIDGLLNTVGDTHQLYVPKEDVQLEASDISGQFEGIGADVEQKGGQVRIAGLIPDYPASRSNLRVGDVILAVDGKSTQSMTVNAVTLLVRGKAGTNVTLNVQHSDGKTEDITITRATVKLNSVHTDQLLDASGNPVDDLAYLRIDQFQQGTDQEVATYLKDIQGKPYKGLILDLRNNPGGLLVSTEHILDFFLKRGQTELITQGRDGAEQLDAAQSGSASTSLPMVVLVNKNSASASEITAGALRDNGRATIMGEQTFGKGTVNQFIHLKTDGGELYVTVARWLTPKRQQIEGQGITPDVVVHLGENDDAKGYNNQQLYQAIDFLHGKQS